MRILHCGASSTHYIYIYIYIYIYCTVWRVNNSFYILLTFSNTLFNKLCIILTILNPKDLTFSLKKQRPHIYFYCIRERERESITERQRLAFQNLKRESLGGLRPTKIDVHHSLHPIFVPSLPLKGHAT